MPDKQTKKGEGLPANRATLAWRGSYGQRAIPLTGSPTISKVSLCHRREDKPKKTLTLISLAAAQKTTTLTTGRILTV